MENLKVGQEINCKIKEINYNNVVFSKSDKEMICYDKEMPKVSAEILILDEPTIGLDPQTRHMVWNQIVDLKTQEITVLLTSHNMEEAA